MQPSRRHLLLGAAALAGQTAAGCASAGTAPGAIRRLSPGMDAVVAPGAVLERIAEGLEWAEGPVWVKSGGYLLFTDPPRNVIHRWSRAEGSAVFLQPSGFSGTDDSTLREAGANGLIVDAAGDLLLCDSGSRAVSRVNLATKARTVLADRFQGKRFNSPNDLTLARGGAIYFTDPPYGLKGMAASPARELPFSGVFRLLPDGSVSLIDDTLSFPNGVALSPDERTLYVSVSDPDRPVIMAYALGTDGLPTASRLFFDAKPLMKDGAPGLPDGLSVDTAGRLYATGPGGVLVITPAGELLGVIQTGGPVANCAFGEDGHTLFLAADDHIARLRLKASGPAFL